MSKILKMWAIPNIRSVCITKKTILHAAASLGNELGGWRGPIMVRHITGEQLLLTEHIKHLRYTFTYRFFAVRVRKGEHFLAFLALRGRGGGGKKPSFRS